jgi:hypothetical protein
MFVQRPGARPRLWTTVLGAALERAGGALAAVAAHRVPRLPRVDTIPTALAFPRVRRPVAHPRRRSGGPSPLAAAAEAGAARAADRLRERLRDVQAALRALQQRLGQTLRRNR